MGPQSGGIDGSSNISLDSDCVHAVLDDPRRRQVLEVVSELQVATTRDLATQIVAREQGIEPQQVSESQRRDLTVELYHVHIPKLAEVGVVTVDRGMERVRPGPMAPQVREVLEQLSTQLDESNDGKRPDAR